MKRQTHAVIAMALALSVGLPGAAGARAEASVRTTAQPHGGTCSGEQTLPTNSNLGLIDSAIMCLIGRERAHYRLVSLQPNRDLQGIASSLAREMAVSGYFGDNSVAGETPWQRVTASPYARDARSLFIAQNIGWGTDALATPSGMVNAWMHSAPHRHIILTSAYRDIGAGAEPVAPSSLTDEKPGATYTVDLAAR